MTRRRIEGLLPPLLWAAVVEKMAELRRLESRFGSAISPPFEEWLLRWRTRIEAFFLAHAFTSTRGDGQKHWDLLAANRGQFDLVILRPMLAELDDLIEDAIEEAREEEPHAYHFGALLGRWQLAVGGVGDRGTRWPLYVGAAILGLGFGPRARRWGRIYGRKLRTALRGAILTQQTLLETIASVDALATGLTGRMRSLAQNEWYHAAVEGEDAAVRPFRAVMGKVWLIKDDNACEFCKSLHRTITTLIPVKDSHPACRCVVTPLVTNFIPTPLSFQTFLDRHV
jgi:hypothetical protein